MSTSFNYTQEIMEEKYKSEIGFWKKEFSNFEKWANGELVLYNTSFPITFDKKDFSPQELWTIIFQQSCYLEELQLFKGVFKHKKILEIGCGPISGVGIFKKAMVYGIDPLMNDYYNIGYRFPQDKNFTIFACRAEELTNIFPKNFFDGIISINAIDHVDNIEKTSNEIRKVVKSNCLFAMNIEYHEPRICEPIILNDKRVEKLFNWVPSLRKIDQIDNKVIWRNF